MDALLNVKKKSFWTIHIIYFWNVQSQWNALIVILHDCVCIYACIHAYIHAYMGALLNVKKN